jgi:succinylglutamate desuccinylase
LNALDFMPQFDRVLIVGGTHGNELTGVYLIRSGVFADLTQFSFKVEMLLANPPAVAAHRRYLDRDLNRSFDPIDRNRDRPHHGAENALARDINQRFGSQGTAPVDVIIDLHTTTADMGNTLIIDEVSPWALPLAAALAAVSPTVKIYSTRGSGRHDALRTIAPLGLCLEIGPVAPGVLDAAAFAQTRSLVMQVLGCLDRLASPVVELPFTIYRYDRAIDYPRNQQGQPTAMIHPQRQHCNYAPLHPGDPMFIDFAGNVIAYEGETTGYPVFINEAAYYEKGIAMILTTKETCQI